MPDVHLFKSFILQVQDYITSLNIGIRAVDEDKGQIDAYEVLPKIALPCLLVDFNINYDDLGDGAQQAEGDMILRLAFPPYSSSTSNVPLTYRGKALSFFDLEHLLCRALSNWKPTGMNYFGRRSAITERREDNLRVREIRFGCSFIDDTGMPDRETASFDVEVEQGDSI